MGESARVESMEALKFFRQALWKFKEAADAALSDAESEVHRTMTWLEMEQRQYWAGQIRKRGDNVEKAKEAVRMKTLFKNSTGSYDSAVEERKALALAQKRLEEAVQKSAAVKRSIGRLQKESHVYKGAVQRFATSVQQNVPSAAGKLDAVMTLLEQYLSINVDGSGTVIPAEVLAAAGWNREAVGSGGMKQGEEKVQEAAEEEKAGNETA